MPRNPLVTEKDWEEFFKEGGTEHCPECSTSNWKVYHKPGEHIKKGKEADNENIS